jgi:beta-galactosidase
LLFNEQQVSSVLEAPSGVKVTRRDTTQGTLLFLLNHNAESVQITLPAERHYHELLTEKTVAAPLTLGARDVAILSVTV